MTGAAPASVVYGGTDADQASVRRTGWVRRHRAFVACAAVVAAALVLVLWAQLGPKGDAVPMSVHNAGPDGHGRHAEHDRACFILGDSGRAGPVQLLQPHGAVIAHTG